MSYLESLRVFVRVVELGSITAGGRDLRLSPAVASNRIKDLENRFGLRLLNRTTRKLTTTEIGRAFYDHARRVIETLDEAEALIGSFSGKPQGVIRLTAPLGLGRRLVAPLIPPFCADNPGIEIRLRLSDRNVNLVARSLNARGCWSRRRPIWTPRARRCDRTTWRVTTACCCAIRAARNITGRCRRRTGRAR